MARQEQNQISPHRRSGPRRLGPASEAEVDAVANLRTTRSEIRSLRESAGSGMYDCGGSPDRLLISKGELVNRFRFPRTRREEDRHFFARGTASCRLSREPSIIGD